MPASINTMDGSYQNLDLIPPGPGLLKSFPQTILIVRCLTVHSFLQADPELLTPWLVPKTAFLFCCKLYLLPVKLSLTVLRTMP